MNNRPVPKVPGGSDEVWSIRLDPPPRQGRDRFDKWQFGDGTASRLIGAEVIETVLTVAMRSFQTLLNRESLLELLENMDGDMVLGGALAHMDPQTLRAVILSDYGVSKELTAALQQVAADTRQQGIAGHGTWPTSRRAVIEWVIARTTNVKPIAGTMGEDTVVTNADSRDDGLAPGERFLYIFRELESWMRHSLKKEESYGYGRMVKDLHLKSAITEAQAQQLATFGYLRNALAHWQTDSDGTAIADPRPNTLAEFQQLASRVMKPVLATRAVGEQTVLTLQIDDRIEDFLTIVREHNYSQVPVMSSGTYIGILTVGAIARWLAEKSWHNPGDFRHSRISAVAFRELEDPEFEEHPPSLTAPEAVSAFNPEANEGAIAGIVIIDRNDGDDHVVAMIVPWDIPALLKAT